MAQKNATPNREQAAILRRNGLDPHYWTIVKELHLTLIVRNRVTYEVKLVNK